MMVDCVSDQFEVVKSSKYIEMALLGSDGWGETLSGCIDRDSEMVMSALDLKAGVIYGC
jgi:hypothetical protein